MAKITILHLVNSLSDSSITRIIERIIRSSDADQFAWTVAALNPVAGLTDTFQAAGAQVLHFNSPAPWRELVAYLRSRPVQIIHTHTPRAIVQAWRAVRTLDGTVRPGHLATKHLLTGIRDRRWGLAYALVDGISLYLPDHLVPVSITMSRRISAMPGIHASKLTPIPNAIPCEAFYQPAERVSARAELGFPQDALVLGYAGRLDRVKRIDFLLAAFQTALEFFPSARLLLLGEGSMKSVWQEQATRRGLSDKVRWAGFRPDMPRMLAAMDIYVQPSSNEGLSLSILEAMAAGKPVIATTVGAASEVIQTAVTGLLIPPGSEAALTTAVLNLLRDAEKRERIARAGQNWVRAHHSVEGMTAAYLQLYRSLVEVSC